MMKTEAFSEISLLNSLTCVYEEKREGFSQGPEELKGCVPVAKNFSHSVYVSAVSHNFK